MRGKDWLNHFCESLDKTDYPKKPITDTTWTNFMYDVMNDIAKRSNCRVGREHLNIDAMFFNNKQYGTRKDQARRGRRDPFVLPEAAVELENWPTHQKISACLWKLMCIRTPLRVLICYQNSKARVKKLKGQTKNIIRKGSLMKGTDGELLVIIGNDDGGRNEDAPMGRLFYPIRMAT